jgi:hypothetical protein
MACDVDGRITRRKHCGPAGGSYQGGCFLDHSYTYDPRAKIVSVSSTGMDPISRNDSAYRNGRYRHPERP